MPHTTGYIAREQVWAGIGWNGGPCRPAWLQRKTDLLSAQHYNLSAFVRSVETEKRMADFDRMLKRYATALATGPRSGSDLAFFSFGLARSVICEV